MDLLIVKNEVVKPQDHLIRLGEFKFSGIDMNGSLTKFDFQEFIGNYLVLLFLRLESEIDFDDVALLTQEKKKFEDLGCQMVGVTSASPLALEMFMENELGGKVGFPILSDKAMVLSMQFGVGLTSGTPVKSTIILDKTMQVRFIQTQRNEINRGVGEIARLVAAYQFTDDTEQALAASWTPDSEGGIIPCDFGGKNKYFKEQFLNGHEGSEGQANVNKEEEESMEEKKQQGGNFLEEKRQ